VFVLLLSTFEPFAQRALLRGLDDGSSLTTSLMIETRFVGVIMIQLFALLLSIIAGFPCDTHIKLLKMFRASR
jgi:hypothetical protein